MEVALRGSLEPIQQAAWAVVRFPNLIGMGKLPCWRQYQHLLDCEAWACPRQKVRPIGGQPGQQQDCYHFQVPCRCYSLTDSRPAQGVLEEQAHLGALTFQEQEARSPAEDHQMI